MTSVSSIVRVPPAVTALAAQRDLGPRKAVFRERAISVLVLWLLTAAVTAVAITIGLLGWHGPALILIGAFLVGISLRWYIGAGRCAVVYEHGVVCRVGPQLRSVRWDEVRYSWRSTIDTAILPQAEALEATGAGNAPDLSGQDGRLMVRRISGMTRFQQLVDAEVQPRAFARGVAQLAAGRQADFPPLAVTAAGLYVNPGKGTIHAPWAAVDSYSHVGGVLVINAFVNDAAKGRVAKQWFRGLVTDATAADWVMDAANPDPDTPQPEKAAELLVEDIADETEQLWQRSRRQRRRTALHGAAFAAVVIGGAAVTTIHLPRHGLGYAAVCGGKAASRAAAYVPGSGPHPIDFEGGSGGFAGVDDNAGVLTDENPQWVPASAAEVQLVACVTGVKTDTQVDTCSYTTADVPMKAEHYTISVYAARTGTKVAGPIEIDGDDSSCPESIITHNGQGPSSFHTKLRPGTVEAAVADAVNG